LGALRSSSLTLNRHLAPRHFRVRIAGWRSARSGLPKEEETQPEKTKTAFNERKNKMN
jgi:hypothetical protein